MVRVAVDIDSAPVGSAELKALRHSDEWIDLYEVSNPITGEARDAARQVVEELVSWARVQWRQPWLGLSSEIPEMAGPTEVIDLDTGQSLDLAPPVMLHSGSLRRESDAIDADGMRQLLEAVSRAEPAPLAETLLADAEYLAWEHFPADEVRAVLMAAIAAEVKVKNDLVSRARPEQRRLIEYALDNPREITVTAVDGLYDSLMKAAQGRSLKDDDRALFNRLRRLFKLRNDIAHRGKAPPPGEAQVAVRAARDAIGWVGKGASSSNDGE